MKRLACALPVVCFAVALSAAEPDCVLGDRYRALSAKATEEFRQKDAYDFMERAAAACPSYDVWMRLGRLAQEFGEEEQNARAAEAYVAAYEAGTTAPQQAVAIAGYAELLFHTNDPQKALTYIQQAHNLDPANAQITELAVAIHARAANVTAEDIKRGLGETAFKPLRVQPAPNDPSSAAGGSAVADKRAVNIPLNFEFNSTRLDGATSKNITVLAETLAGSDYASRQFLFVGHADVRGRANDNMLLSVERANAIAQEVAKLAPTLKDRIKTMGRGEEQPLSLGTAEEDHRVNRRLEVVLQ